VEGAIKRSSFFDTVKTVLWGMIGIRRMADHQRVSIKPLHLIVTAVLFVVLFVLTLRFIVGLVVS
jgi:Protein of unknown function (DUF2970)